MRLGRWLAALAAATTTGLLGSAAADTTAEFYRGATLTIIVATDAGGSFDLYSRVLANHFGRHLPGRPDAVVQNMAGAGGTRAANYMANAVPKDGSVVSAVLSTSVLAPILQDVKFDASKFGWLGTIAGMTAVVSLWHTAPATDLAGLRRTEVVMGATGKGNETATIPHLMNAIAGTKFKVVTGYPGSAQINLAIEKGEVHGRIATWDSWAGTRADWLRERKLVHIVQYGTPTAETAGVPNLGDLVSEPGQRAMVDLFAIGMRLGRAYYVPPGTPPDRLAALRRAFDATMNDPAFRHEAAQRSLTVDPRPGEALQAMMVGLYATPAQTVAELKRLTGLDR